MFDHIEVEKKWQKYWEENNTFKTDVYDFSKPKYYALDMFPYPSGVGLHAGHPEGYTATDVICRMKRMQGYNVLHPMGFDSFGLPAEQYAINTGNHPEKFTLKNIQTFTKQLKMLGFSYDWTKEVSTCDPEFYHWTQWIFKQLYKDGLAKNVDIPVNWCEELQTVLANDEVINGKSERGGYPVIRKNMKQWVIDICQYADRLLEGLNEIDWPESTKEIQRNWIGRSYGAHVDFKVDGHDDSFTVFTTRCDTLFGATYCVLAPEHVLVAKITTEDKKAEVEQYVKECATKSEMERTQLNKDKTGVFTGAYAINPVNNKKIPIWISDYVLASYGTGAIMAVPAHDERDYAFAKKFNIDIIQVLEGGDITKEAYTLDGTHINSGFLNGLGKEEAIKKMLEYLEKEGIGHKKINYKLQDWVFSRQRFWGEPIPMIYCEKCGFVPVSEKDLPVTLPNVASYEPTDDGESPLANITDWVNTTCPKCGGSAKRETDTMPNWAGSSWYYLRYMDPNNTHEFVSNDAMKYWNQVDYYNGGMEHATRHLLYARFWHNFLYDQGLVPYNEPFKKRVAHGMILGANGEKMSKSKGNVVNPDDMVNLYGADALRCYEMFIGDYTADASWSENGLKGCKKFLERVYRLGEKLNSSPDYSKDTLVLMNQTIKKVTEDLENMKYNTAVSSLMILLNELEKLASVSKKDYRTLIHLLNPISPHITEELNEKYNLGAVLCESSWPSYDKDKLENNTYTMVVQVNGKVRGKIEVATDTKEEEMKTLALEIENVKNFTNGKEVVKIIVVPKKLVNIVVK